MQVDVYKNLHTGNWSVLDRKTGRVCKHLDRVSLRDVTFVVRPAGRERVRREGKKYVHAFARGTFMHFHDTLRIPHGVRVSYNPYNDLPGFYVCGSETGVVTAPMVHLNPEGVWVLPLELPELGVDIQLPLL